MSETISLGAIAYPEHDVNDGLMLVQYADEAMYQAKELGRNRIFLV